MTNLIDRFSDSWKTVVAFIEGEARRARNDLEGLGCTEVRAQQLRGELEAYRKILDLPEQLARPRIESGHFD